MAEAYKSLLFLIGIVAVFALIIFVYAFRGRRALFKVIEIFRQHNALRVNETKTLAELGLEPPDLLQRMMRGRDYKQYALRILIKKGVIQTTEDGRFYMVESKLDEALHSIRRP